MLQSRLPLLVCLMLAACNADSERGPEAPAGPLNVVVVTLDTTRADALGAYGQQLPVTPRLDAMAAQGVLFEQAMSSTPSTLPSHATLFTGRQPYSHGVRSNIGYRLSEENVTLAEVLAEGGWKTAAQIAAPVLTGHRQLSQGFDEYREPQMAIMDAVELLEVQIVVENLRHAEEITEGGLEFLRAHADEPFFLWLHYFDPHVPRDPPAPFAGRFENPYLEEVNRVDHEVGRVLDEIERLGLRDRTLVVLTADHGEGLGEHREQTHSFFVYQSTLRVPLIFWGAGVPAGVRVGSLVRLTDVTPTVLDWLGLPPLAGVEGVSLAPLFGDPGRDLGLTAYGETIEWRVAFGGSVLRTLREGRWKYLHKREPALYDLAVDPGETRDLAAEQPSRVEEMRRRLEELLASAPSAPVDSESPLSPEDLEQLRALGYAAELNAPQTASDLDSLDVSGPDPDRSITDLTLYLKAVTALSTGDLEIAEVFYAQVCRHHPRSATALAGLIQVKQALERDDEVVEKLMWDFLELEPDTVGQRVELAKVLVRRGDVKTAERLLREALDLDPCSQGARLQLSQIERTRGRQAQRIAILAGGIESCPEPQVLRNALAYALATVPDDSLRDGERALLLAEASVDATNSMHPDYLDTLAAAYAESGDFERALETQRRALSLVEGRALRPRMVEHLKRHLERYEAGQPLRLP